MLAGDVRRALRMHGPRGATGSHCISTTTRGLHCSILKPIPFQSSIPEQTHISEKNPRAVSQDRIPFQRSTWDLHPTTASHPRTVSDGIRHPAYHKAHHLIPDWHPSPFQTSIAFHNPVTPEEDTRNWKKLRPAIPSQNSILEKHLRTASCKTFCCIHAG